MASAHMTSELNIDTAAQGQQRCGEHSRAAIWPMGAIRNSSRNNSRRGNSSMAGRWRPRSRKMSTSARCSASTVHMAASTQNAMRAALQSATPACSSSYSHLIAEQLFTVGSATAVRMAASTNASSSCMCHK